MLAASRSAPNSQRKPLKSTPTPDNWFGVSEGIAAAKDAAAVGDFDKAEEVLTELLEFAPSEVTALKMLARIQKELGKYQEGIINAKRAIRLQNIHTQQQAPASVTLARLLWLQGEQKQAAEMLELLLLNQPDNVLVHELKQQWNKETCA